MQIHITTTGCSETPWGLRFQMEGSGLCTRLIVFTSVEAGTVELSLSLHGAGFGRYTHPFELAATYVFIKQSEFPCYCDQLLTQLAPLIPKLQG